MLNFDDIEHLLNIERIFYKKNEMMKYHTSFKIGGICKILAYPETFEKVSKIVQICNEFRIKHFFLGNGTNLLVSDSGFLGVGICSSMLNKIKILNKNEIYCESGVPLMKLCRFALFKSLSGLEFAYGIPGSLGGAVFMNAGAYGGEMKDVVKSVSFVDCNGSLKVLNASKLNFSYRTSVFEDSKNFILSARIKCKAGNQLEIKNKMNELMKRRIDKQPLNFPSAGSIFKRPKKGYASRLIESCGLKSKSVGGVKVSEKHCGFIINFNKGSCDDVLSLIAHIQKVVEQRTGIFLEPEVKLVE